MGEQVRCLKTGQRDDPGGRHEAGLLPGGQWRDFVLALRENQGKQGRGVHCTVDGTGREMTQSSQTGGRVASVNGKSRLASLT
jgi:hypothetical protein